MFSLSPIRRICNSAVLAVASSACLLPPASAMGYKYVDPKVFSTEGSAQVLRKLGANESLVKINGLVSDKMEGILRSSMVQGMARSTLSKEEWDKKYMRPDALYIYKLGQELAKRASYENEEDRSNVMEFATMFLGYGKHFDRLKIYGLSPDDQLVSPECDAHIALLSTGTSIKEFYISLLTDMIPYVVFANYLLHSIEPADNNPWIDYARKYGDLENKYAKERLGKIIAIANRILANREVDNSTAAALFAEGFTFEEWFIIHAFSKGFTIAPSQNKP